VKLGAVLVAVAAALVWSAAAFAGGPFVNTLNSPPADLSAGDVWVAKVRAVNCLGSPAATGMRPLMRS
jgi:hypothetical protein